MSMLGADVDALRGLARSLRARRGDVLALHDRMVGVVTSLPWAGGDHDRFVDDWHRRHLPALRALAAELDEAAQSARRHADRQAAAAASNGTGAGTWPSRQH